jgi:hypothetical protein
MEEVQQIFNLLRLGAISVDEAEQRVLDEFIINGLLTKSTECNCCYMTTGEHAETCPKYTKS